MALEKSEAFVLKMFNWSESSRTVLFFTHRFGRLPLIDRGGRSLKSKRGRIMPFARMELSFYKSEKQTTGYLSDCEILETFEIENHGSLGRLAYGSAVCELLNLLLPEEEVQEELYEYALRYLRAQSKADRRALPALFLACFLRMMSQLGYHPSLAYCVGCGKEAGAFKDVAPKRMFSPERGGMVCAACQKPGEYYIGLSPEQHRVLMLLQRASLDEAATIPLGFQEATYLAEALAKFLRFHSGLISDIKSLEFLDKLKQSHLG